MLLFITTRPYTLDIKRRLRHFANLGVQVRHFHFARENYPEIFHTLSSRRVGTRLWDLATGIFRLRRLLRGMTKADIIFVHALDSLVATIIARANLRIDAPLACQILDAHALLLSPGPYRPLLRAVERWALSRTDLLIVPNIGNITRYYGPTVGYRGAFAVVHNTLPTGEVANPTPPPVFEGVWIIGWFGSLRCQRSVEILCRTAQALGGKVKILIAGISKLPPGTLEAAIKPFANIRYLGPYDAFQDATRLYRGVHIAHALHFEVSEKAKWALPVRILEGGAHGRPALARADTDAGQFVRDHRIGWTVDAPFEENLVKFITALTPEDYRRAVESVCAQPRLFIGEDHLGAALAQLKR